MESEGCMWASGGRYGCGGGREGVEEVVWGMWRMPREGSEWCGVRGGRCG